MSRPATNLSQASSRAGTRGYRVTSRHSEVDESLFGFDKPKTSGSAAAARQNGGATPMADFFSGAGTTHNTTSGRRGTSAPSPVKQETIRIVTSDQIRTLRVPKAEPESSPLILSRDEFLRIKESASVKSKDELERERRARKERLYREADEAGRRKAEIEEMELRRTRSMPPSSEELEAQAKAEALRSRAQHQIEEREEEIRQLNEMILQAKCYAIRDAQLMEKQAISQEMRQEQLRLDQMMEVERLRKIKDAEEAEKASRQSRALGAEQIRAQLLEREQQRLIEEELRDQETQSIIQKLERMRAEDLEVAKRKKEKDAKIMDDVNAFNQQALELKREAEIAAQREEERIVEYMKLKAIKEKELEEEKRRAIEERDKDFTRMLGEQEKAMDKVAERQTLQAKRQQEQVERERRKRDKIEADKKKQLMEQIEAERQRQVAAKERVLVAQMKQDKAEFERVLRAQQDVIEAEERKKREDLERLRGHRMDVQHQIKDKEQHIRTQRDAFFEEGKKLDAEAQARRQRLDDIKQQKLAELKALGIKEEYIVPVKKLAASPQKV